MDSAQAEVPVVRVVVVNFNAGAYLAECLEALRVQTHRAFEAVVVDNASTDGSLAAVPDDPRFRVLRLRQNVGFAAGNNRGADGAGTKWLAFLNPDAVPAPDWLSQLLAAAERSEGIRIFGSTQIDARDPMKLDGTGDAYFALGLPWRGGFGHARRAAPPAGEIFGPCAAAALYGTDLFRKLEGFDEDFFCYCEDVDLAFRARLHGERCAHVPEAQVRHYGSAIAGRHSDFSQFHSARNRIWLFVKNMPGPLALALAPGFAFLQGALVLWAAVRGHGRPVGAGVVAGLRGLGPALAKRRQLQSARRASTWSIGRALSWSPLRVLTRAPDVRPVRN